MAERDMQVLNERFKLTSQECTGLFVGMNVTEHPDGSVELSSEAYINSLVGKYLNHPLGGSKISFSVSVWTREISELNLF